MESPVQIEVTARCPIRTTLELIGGKWKLLIIYQLAQQPLRFSALKKLIPNISEKMLIQELKVLIDSQLVERVNFGEVPPKVEYNLSEIGRFTLPLIAEMQKFAQHYTSKIDPHSSTNPYE
ncbi:MAG TPA: transcriptional regulator [Microscillaceae bacterium]|jgi:DNA-binding HxlR family transcriptional regulator|nr:transcriptional regulator [Microscillaceae bacterium]